MAGILSVLLTATQSVGTESCFSESKSCLILCHPMDCSMPGFLVPQLSWSLLNIMSIESVMLANHLILCLTLLLILSIPGLGSFPMSWLFASGGQRIEASASASVLPKHIQGWFPLGLTDLISLLSQRLSRVFSSITVWRHQFFGTQSTLWFNSHICIHIMLDK